MRLKNKKTGEIGVLTSDNRAKPYKKDYAIYVEDDDFEVGDKTYYYDSFAEICEDWEDYEEPKEYWYIDSTCLGGIDKVKVFDCEHCQKIDDFNKSIGNYFVTKKDAKLAVKKLKAWKRLRDKGFKFCGVYDDFNIRFTAPKEEIGWYWCNGMDKDLDLLFGGEDE